MALDLPQETLRQHVAGVGVAAAIDRGHDFKIRVREEAIGEFAGRGNLPVDLGVRILTSVIENLIHTDPEILGGKPVIRGTRISVAFVLQSLASGMTVEDILHSYPHLTREAVLAAVDFAARAFDGEVVLPPQK